MGLGCRNCHLNVLAVTPLSHKPGIMSPSASTATGPGHPGSTASSGPSGSAPGGGEKESFYTSTLFALARSLAKIPRVEWAAVEDPLFRLETLKVAIPKGFSL